LFPNGHNCSVLGTRKQESANNWLRCCVTDSVPFKKAVSELRNQQNVNIQHEKL
jgi:hypothetical protein